MGIIEPCMERGTNLTKPKRQGAREARGGKEGKREFDRCERQRAEDAAAPSSCPRRTNLDRFPNVRPGSGSADPGIFGYFPSMESTSPGGEISPVLLRKSGPGDRQKTNFGRRALHMTNRAFLSFVLSVYPPVRIPSRKTRQAVIFQRHTAKKMALPLEKAGKTGILKDNFHLLRRSAGRG